MITGNEPFYPQSFIESPHIKREFGITIRQEAILRFMETFRPRYSAQSSDICAEEAVIFADAYIKILNNEK